MVDDRDMTGVYLWARAVAEDPTEEALDNLRAELARVGGGEVRTKVPDEPDLVVKYPTSHEWQDVQRMTLKGLSDGSDSLLDDDDASTEYLRGCVMRTRLAAAVERQAHQARAVVFDMIVNDDPKEGKPVWRFVVSTPTGDAREMRDAAILMWATWLWSIRSRGDNVTLEKPEAEQ